MTPSHSGLADLVLRARDGRQDALGSLLRQHRGYLRVLAELYVQGQLRSKADPSDLVQETLLQASLDFDQFRGCTEAEFVQWLRALLMSKGRKLARRYYGTQRRNLRRELPIEDANGAQLAQIAGFLVASESSANHRVVNDEVALAVADALSRLPKLQRRVMMLHHIEGLPMNEVAVKMERSLDAVRKLWARALVKLRPMLNSQA